MSHTWILTALGKDRPGIVAGVTKLLYELGCNLEDSAMSRLAGEFAIMLIFTAKRSISEEQLEGACRLLGRKMDLAIHLKRLSSSELSTKSKAKAYFLSVYGADRPGIVYRISQLLSEMRVNITDVSTQRSRPSKGGLAKTLYLMVLDVELPMDLSPKKLEQRLKVLAKKLHVETNLRSGETQLL